MLEYWTKLRRISWHYDRWSTTATVGTVSGLTGLAAWSMLPRGTAPDGPAAVVAAGVGAYVVVRLGFATGVSKHLKHEWLDRFEGDVDDAQTWLLGTLGGAATLVVLRGAGQRLGRAGRTEPSLGERV